MADLAKTVIGNRSDMLVRAIDELVAASLELRRHYEMESPLYDSVLLACSDSMNYAPNSIRLKLTMMPPATTDPTPIGARAGDNGMLPDKPIVLRICEALARLAKRQHAHEQRTREYFANASRTVELEARVAALESRLAVTEAHLIALAKADKD